VRSVPHRPRVLHGGQDHPSLDALARDPAGINALDADTARRLYVQASTVSAALLAALVTRARAAPAPPSISREIDGLLTPEQAAERLHIPHDHDGCIGEPARHPGERGERSEPLAVAHDDETVRLAVLRAAGHAAGLKDSTERLLGQHSAEKRPLVPLLDDRAVGLHGPPILRDAGRGRGLGQGVARQALREIRRSQRAELISRGRGGAARAGVSWCPLFTSGDQGATG
jgi:hypothetical protein